MNGIKDENKDKGGVGRRSGWLGALRDRVEADRRTFAFAAMMLLLANTPLPAQSGAGGEAGMLLTIVGQWSGPFPLESEINIGNPLEWAEIVHMVTLPPPNSGYVLFWNRRNRLIYKGGGSPPSTITLDYKTWLWNPNSPNSLIPVTILDTGAAKGRLDPFCGAHTSLQGSDGRTIVMGGTDMYLWETGGGANGTIVGTKGVFEFNNADAAVPSNLQWTVLPSLVYERYYGGCLRKDDGVIVTYGNAGAQGTANVEQMRERYVSGGSWSTHDNVRWGTNCTNSTLSN